jgi:hypothetical protein
MVLLVGLALAATGCQSTDVRGPEGQQFAATTPMSLTISRGETKMLDVQVDRSKMAGTVTVAISQLPSGVSADQSSQAVQDGQSKATFILKADMSAGLVSNQAVRIVTSGPSGMQSTQYMKLTVKD